MGLSIGVYGNIYSDDLLDVVKDIKSHPSVSEVMYYKDLADKIGERGYILDEMESSVDFIVALGGDGTLLHLFQRTEKPVLGVNTGTVGFLTAVELKDLNRALERIENGDYLVDERMKLKSILNGEEIVECTNEAVVHTNKVAKIREMEIYQGDTLIERFRADGVIISTPTGSTCYSMSSGGPIIHPDVEAFVIVAISPFKLASKPYVVPVDEEIRVVITEKDKPCLLVLDGKKEISISSEDDVVFQKGEGKARFITFDKDFYKKVRQKLVRRL